MKRKQLIMAAIAIVSFAFTVKAQQDGQTIFSTKCSACHSIGKGRLVGPDLKGVNAKYNIAYLTKWIKSSQTVIKSGDTKAKALFEEYNSIVMPDFQDLKEADIKALVGYIKSQSVQSTTSGSQQAKSQTKAAPKK